MGIVLLIANTLGLTFMAGVSWVIYVSLRKMQAEAAIRRRLSAIGVLPRPFYAESYIWVSKKIPVFRDGKYGEKDTPGNRLQTDPLTALFLFANQVTLSDLQVMAQAEFMRAYLKVMSVPTLRRIELFVAAAELPDSDFKKVRRLMTSRQREAADGIRLNWRGRLTEQLNTKAQVAQELDDAWQQKELWAKERKNLDTGADLTDWLRAQGPDMWHEVCLNIRWTQSDAAALVPFVEWLVVQPELDTGSALVLLANAVCDGIDHEAYEQHDCARNQDWMKVVHDGLVNDRYSPMKFAIPPWMKAEVRALFVHSTGGAWTVPLMQIESELAKAHDPADAFIANQPIESFAAWQLRSS